MAEESPIRPPNGAGPLAAWFAEAVREEVAALERNGGSQTYEVLSGRIVQSPSPNQCIMQFILADGTRIPVEASGRLRTPGGEYAASVIGQEANRVQLLLEAGGPLPPTISRGQLIVDDTALLRRLAEVLEANATDPSTISPLAVAVFHPETVEITRTSLPDHGYLRCLEEEKRHIIGQACASPITFVWGPPGTGKTHLIAHLIATFVDAGERVLVSTHTNVAVDQTLYEAVKTEGDAGPLAESPLLEAGKIVRVGQTTNKKVPDKVRLEKIVETRARDLEVEILKSEGVIRPLLERLSVCRLHLAEWDGFQRLTTLLDEARGRLQDAVAREQDAQETILRVAAPVELRRAHLAKAERAWLWRTSKVQRALLDLRAAEDTLHTAEATLVRAYEDSRQIKLLVDDLRLQVDKGQEACRSLPSRTALDGETEYLQQQITPLAERIGLLKAEITRLHGLVIQGARALFCTLTKNFAGKELDGQQFEAVIVDEISMALPPLLFLAAARAKARVILVGDPYQLPPIVRSDVPLSNARLGTDTFELSQVRHTSVLTGLSTQRRMAPLIAEAARHLVYYAAGHRFEDHPIVRLRSRPEWLERLPGDPLITVDTADLNCWSGKQVGTLSRFNFYSATIAVELAAIAASVVRAPAEDEAPPIGIVTPFAAQRRLLSKLVESMDLFRWVTAGTVHTFQGSQADLIIFDSVLDEPYWSARLSSPASAQEVLRELNVAVTRAKHKFVFVGSSEWLNRHAHPASGLGQLWSFLKEHAALVPAGELVGPDLASRLLPRFDNEGGWSLPTSAATSGVVHEILDETSFFDRFTEDLASASKSIFGLVPYFGEYRWPRIEPLFRAALERGVEVTLVTPPLSEATNPGYVGEATRALRGLGAVVISSSGLHGKDIVIDERVHYTGSLNWASHRGKVEVMHRTEIPALARLVVDFMQAKHIRLAAVHPEGGPRACPQCEGPTHVVNQRTQSRFDMRQALKIGCAQYQETHCNYLRDIDERAPFREVPRCQRDGRTRYRRVRRGRGEVWRCPKHPKECETFRVVPGDP